MHRSRRSSPNQTCQPSLSNLSYTSDTWNIPLRSQDEAWQRNAAHGLLSDPATMWSMQSQPLRSGLDSRLASRALLLLDTAAASLTISHHRRPQHNNRKAIPHINPPSKSHICTITCLIHDLQQSHQNFLPFVLTWTKKEKSSQLWLPSYGNNNFASTQSADLALYHNEKIKKHILGVIQPCEANRREPWLISRIIVTDHGNKWGNKPILFFLFSLMFLSIPPIARRIFRVSSSLVSMTLHKQV